MPIRDIQCANCASLIPLPENVNYLTLFEFPDSPPFNFDIDLGRLRKQYLTMMQKVHPDSVGSESQVLDLWNSLT